jgi:hypothetical protein
MKLYTIILLSLLWLFPMSSYAQSFGEVITDEGAISVEEMIKSSEGKKKFNCKVTGTVLSVCQKKGCWMELMRPDGGTIRVTFKDYEFFVPKDISGKTVVMEGFSWYRETSVEMLRHYAQDAGKSEEEIKKIDKPKKELAFEAKGVIVK